MCGTGGSRETGEEREEMWRGEEVEEACRGEGVGRVNVLEDV